MTMRQVEKYVRRSRRLPKYVLRNAWSRVIRAAFYEQPLASKGDINRQTNILVVRTDGLGDVILTTPLFKHLKATFEHARTCVLTRDEWVDVLKESPHIDEIIPWDINRYRASIRYRLRFIESLKKRSFDLALHPVYSREPLSDEIVCCTPASQKIGFDGDLNNIRKRQRSTNDRYYTRLIKSAAANGCEIDRNRYFTEYVIGRSIKCSDFEPELWITETDRAAAREVLFQNGVDAAKDVMIALFPGAGWKGREWPPERYAALGDHLAEQYAANILILGGPQDIPVASVLQSTMKKCALNLADKLDLVQLAAVIETCGLFIGNETGPLHMAVAAGTPTLAIMGGGHFGRFYPYGDLSKHRMVFKKMDCYGCNWKCIYETTRCIQEITVDDVWFEAQRMMEEVVLPFRRRANVATSAYQGSAT